MSNTAIIDFREAQKSAEELVKQLGNVAKEASSIISLLQRAAKAGDIGDQWASRYGEVMKKSEAAQVLGVSSGFVTALCREGKIVVNKDGWVVTRSVAEWATGEWAASKAKKKSTAPKYTPIV